MARDPGHGSPAPGRAERGREARLAAADARAGKKSKAARDAGRDVSERVALGQARVGGAGGEALYDQRLFNRDGGGVGAVDVEVCTPGRLVDHLESTPGLTLEHLRFLVVDEADRLLNQSYNNWVEKVRLS